MTNIENKRPLRVFLCHSKDDKSAVRDLYKQLCADGIEPWLDEKNLLPGQDWELEIRKAVRNSDAVIVCLSQRAINKKGFVHKEIKYALDVADEQPSGAIFLIPLRLEECEVPERLCSKQWVNLFEESGYDRLMRALHKRHRDMLDDTKIGQKQVVDVERTNIDKTPKIYTNTIGMKFTLIQAGEFMMVSGETDWEKTVRKVKISKPIYLGIYPVTQLEWKEVMTDNHSHFKGDSLPVENASWNDAQKYIKKLNEKEGTNKYRLPSESEWEYAVRAGSTTRYSFGDDESNLGEYAWYYGNSGGKTHEVGQKKPNPWGLYDMHGNVWEWVQDKWHNDYEGAPTDGSAWEGIDFDRVIRGGGWNSFARDCQSAIRLYADPDVHRHDLGFRLLRVL